MEKKNKKKKKKRKAKMFKIQKKEMSHSFME